MVTRIDAHFGNVLQALEDPNGDGDKSDSVAKNTLVVFQSDNGGPGGSNREQLDANGGLLGSKGSIYEEGYGAHDHALAGYDQRGLEIDSRFEHGFGFGLLGSSAYFLRIGGSFRPSRNKWSFLGSHADRQRQAKDSGFSDS